MAQYAQPGALVRHKHSKQLTKTVMCRFFLQGTCGKGNRCAYAHSTDEMRDKPDLSFTSMCRTFLQIGSCPDPDCTFAHSEAQLRTTAGFFKTKRCRFAASGRCRHGNACRFAHSAAELQLAQKREFNEETGEDIPTSASFEETGRNETVTEASSNSGSNQTGESPGPERRQRGQPRNQASHSGGQGSTGGTSSSGDQAPRSTTTTSQQNSRSGGSSDWAEASSDQSTRADTAVSVPTPEGSGDSGQEEFACRAPQAPMPKRRSNETSTPNRRCTTVMLTNIPTFLTQGALVSLLEDLTTNARGAFDFFYCPWDPYEDRNLGYAIVNFFTRAVAADFERQWANKPLLRERGVRKLRIVPAALQGRAANLRHFSDFNLANHPDPRFRPLIRAGPNEPLRPMALCQELPASSNRSSAPANSSFRSHTSSSGTQSSQHVSSQQQQQLPHQQQPQQQYSSQQQQPQHQQSQGQQYGMSQQQVQQMPQMGGGQMGNMMSSNNQGSQSQGPCMGLSRQVSAGIPTEASVPTPAMAGGVGTWTGCNMPFIVVQPNGLGGWDQTGSGWNTAMFANGNGALSLHGAPVGQNGRPEEAMTQMCWMPMQQQSPQQQRPWNNCDTQGERSPDSSDEHVGGFPGMLRSPLSGGPLPRPGTNISYIGA